MDIAEKFRKQHKNVLQAIEKLKCSEGFTKLNFQPSKYTDSTGRALPLYKVTKKDFSFLVMGFTGKKAVIWKEKYINAFDMMEKELLRKQNLEWTKARAEGKAIRHETTDTLKEFIEFAKQQGSGHSDRYFTLFTKLIYSSLFSNFTWRTTTPGGFRDKLDISDLTQVKLFESTLKKIIEAEISKGTHYKKI